MITESTPSINVTGLFSMTLFLIYLSIYSIYLIYLIYLSIDDYISIIICILCRRLLFYLLFFSLSLCPLSIHLNPSGVVLSRLALRIPKPYQKCTNRAKTVHLTLFTMGEIFIIFSIFSDICYFFQIYEK